MSDPNMDAADNYCSIQEAAFEDFEKWCDAQGDVECGDMSLLAERYSIACASGEWKPHAWRETTEPQ